VALRRDHGLLLGTEVQLVVFCTAIETQIVFKMLFALITSQLAIAGQLGREVHLRSIGLLLGSRVSRSKKVDLVYFILFYFLFLFLFYF